MDAENKPGPFRTNGPRGRRLVLMGALMLVGVTPLSTLPRAEAAEGQADVDALQSALDAVHAHIDGLESEVALLREYNARLAALEDYVTVLTDDSITSVRIAGANLQVVNGTGDTETTNGLGNLILGATAASAVFSCSHNEAATAEWPEGRLNRQEACEEAGHVWSKEHRSGSHNVIAGWYHSYSSYGGLVAGGWGNTINAPYAVVGGGQYNRALAPFAVVNGGRVNDAVGEYAVVGGGGYNRAAAAHSSIGGGWENIVYPSATSSSILGGYQQTLSDAGATIPPIIE